MGPTTGAGWASRCHWATTPSLPPLRPTRPGVLGGGRATLLLLLLLTPEFVLPPTWGRSRARPLPTFPVLLPAAGWGLYEAGAASRCLRATTPLLLLPAGGLTPAGTLRLPAPAPEWQGVRGALLPTMLCGLPSSAGPLLGCAFGLRGLGVALSCPASLLSSGSSLCFASSLPFLSARASFRGLFVLSGAGFLAPPSLGVLPGGRLGASAASSLPLPPVCLPLPLSVLRALWLRFFSLLWAVRLCFCWLPGRGVLFPGVPCF